MAEAKEGDNVKVHYTGKLDDGSIFDSSVDKQPLEFTIGQGRLITDFEQAVIGMVPGDSRTVNILSDNAYGPHHKEMVMVVERQNLPPDLEPRVDQQLQVQQENGQEFVVTVTEVTDTTVTLDGNHPLAGKDLTFEIQLVEIA
jgi:peptidylprolyl isomerase